MNDSHRLAIVGTSRLTFDEAIEARKYIVYIINERRKSFGHLRLITGDADGIDKLVREMCLEQGVDFEVLVARDRHWEGENGFRERNLRIAKYCDEIISISTKKKTEECYHHKKLTESHERTGGCWTMEEAKRLKSYVKGRVYVI